MTELAEQAAEQAKLAAEQRKLRRKRERELEEESNPFAALMDDGGGDGCL